jgi:putative membrane protein
MIYYSNSVLWPLLLHYHGSALAAASTLSRTAVLAALSAAMVLLQREWPTLLSAKALDQLLLSASAFLAVLLGLRLFAALRQWQRGVADVSALADAARSLTATACAFVHFSRKGVADRAQIRNKCQFIRDVKRYILLYVTLVFHDCNKSDAPLELRALLTQKEADEFSSTEVLTLGEHTWNRERNVVGSANKMRAAIVELWLRRTVNRARRKSYVTVEQAMELNKIVSTLPEMYTRIFNLCNVPIAFNLAQCLHVCFVGYLLLMAAALAPAVGFMTTLYVAVAALLLFALDNVASAIECPFGPDANDVDLEARILCIQDELKVILQAHFHSVGHVESFNEQDRMASLSSLLSVDVETITSRGRARHGSVSSSYSSNERPSQYSAPSSTSATDRAVLLSIQPDAYGTIEEADDELASPPAMHGSDDHEHIAV